jgi:hypothetical protein
MKWMERAFSYKHIYTGHTLKITNIFALCLAAGLVLPPSTRAQTRVHDLPNGGLAGTYYEVNLLTTSHGTNYIGDLLIIQGGRYVGEPEMYIVHWNGSNFISRGIPLQYYSRTNFSSASVVEIEGACFAPTNFPSQ